MKMVMDVGSAVVKWTKNIVILVLVVLCVLQTGRLWFGGVPSFDFLYILGIEREPPGLREAMQGLIVPKRILGSEGGNLFVCNYSLIEHTEQFHSARAVLLDFLAGGTFAEHADDTEAHFGELLGDRLGGAALVLDYGFSMPAESFAVVLGENPMFLTAYVDFFDKIILTPTDTGAELIFLDTLSETQRARRFTVATQQRLVYTDMRNRHNLIYQASIPASPDFSHLIFMPRSLEGGLTYRQIRQEELILLTRANVQNMMLSFFDNPAVVRQGIPDSNVWHFGDTYATAIFRAWHYIEYRSWGFRGNRTTDNLHEAFAEAVIFMERDNTLDNEIFLSRFEYDGGVFRFFFDFIFDDLPVILDEELRREIGEMESFIEVTVHRGRVTHYRRIDIRVSSRGDSVQMPLNYRTALLGAPVIYENRGDIRSMELVYTLGTRTAANLSLRVTTTEGAENLFIGD